MRQSAKRRTRNRANRSKVRSEVKRLRSAIAAGDAAKARELLPIVASALDKGAKVGVLHDNAAARTKSRLTRSVNALAAS